MPRPPPIPRNVYLPHGDTTTLRIHRNDGTNHDFTLDTIDVPRVQHRRWRVMIGENGHVYGVVGGNRTSGGMSLGRYVLVLAEPEHYKADQWAIHLNNDPRDCRRVNLRIGNRCDVNLAHPMATHSRTGERNIWPDPNGFGITIVRNGVTHTGYAQTLAEAVAKRDAMLADFGEEPPAKPEWYNRTQMTIISL